MAGLQGSWDVPDGTYLVVELSIAFLRLAILRHV